MTLDDLRNGLERTLSALESTERPQLLTLIARIDGWDAADQADRGLLELDLAQLNVRIGRLRDRLTALERATTPRNGGPVPGMAVVLDFGNGPETYLLAEHSYSGMQVITPGSPLGQALVGVRSGQLVTYQAPGGQATVVVVDFVPVAV